jgi:hypothetical protein
MRGGWKCEARGKREGRGDDVDRRRRTDPFGLPRPIFQIARARFSPLARSLLPQSLPTSSHIAISSSDYLLVI